MEELGKILVDLIQAMLIVVGWNYATKKDKILGFVRIMTNPLPKKLKEWMYGCMVCTSSWIGSAYFLTHQFNHFPDVFLIRRFLSVNA